METAWHDWAMCMKFVLFFLIMYTCTCTCRPIGFFTLNNNAHSLSLSQTLISLSISLCLSNCNLSLLSLSLTFVSWWYSETPRCKQPCLPPLGDTVSGVWPAPVPGAPPYQHRWCPTGQNVVAAFWLQILQKTNYWQ